MEAFLLAPEYKRIDLLYSLIKQDPNYLKAIDQKQFIDTPLHLAAGEGLTLLALEIQRLMPSFGTKLNADGFSPVHVALQRGHNETAKAMVRLNPELVSVQGKEGITPLHHAAKMDDGVDILVEFLVRCPESIDMLTVREETAVHVAVKSRKLASVKVLVGWLKRKGKISVLEWSDFEGNTALHLAASTNQPQVMKVLMHLNYDDVNAKNYEGLTILDLVMRLPSHEDKEKALSMLPRGAKMGSSITPTPPLADYLRPLLSIHDVMGVLCDYLDTDISDQMRSAGLVVSALIATAAYQGVLRSPGTVSSQTPITLNITSYFPNNSSITNTTSPTVRLDVLEAHQAHNTTKTELRMRHIAYAIDFMLPNSWALALSLGMIVLLLPLRLSLSFIHLSLLFLMASTYAVLLISRADWSLQRDLDVGSWVGAISFLLVCPLISWMKIASLRQTLLMRRLKVRDRHITL